MWFFLEFSVDFKILNILSVTQSSPIFEDAPRKLARTPKYMMIPDINGHMYLEDVNNAEIETRFNAAEDVRFFLYTRENIFSPDQIFIDENSIRNSHFKSNRPTRFLIQ